MIHIKKSKSGYRCVYTAKNGEPLAVSEVLTSKANAWKNVGAMAVIFNPYREFGFFYVVDHDKDEYFECSFSISTSIIGKNKFVNKAAFEETYKRIVLKSRKK